MYAKLKPPTLPNQNGETPYIQNARVKFVIDTISYHIDENAWDRLKIISENNKAKWLEILKIDAEGYDSIILKSMLETTETRPKVIIYENLIIDRMDSDNNGEKLNKYITSFDYNVFQYDAFNTICIKKTDSILHIPCLNLSIHSDKIGSENFRNALKKIELSNYNKSKIIKKIAKSKVVFDVNFNKNFKFISHRGNIKGRNIERENEPSYLIEAISVGFEVEIDVWFEDGKYFLGHDKPQYEVTTRFLKNDKLWCHAKNGKALVNLLKDDIHCFYHSHDDYTLTSQNYVWTNPGAKIMKESICVMPEIFEIETTELSKCSGICSDIIEVYKNNME